VKFKAPDVIFFGQNGLTKLVKPKNEERRKNKISSSTDRSSCCVDCFSPYSVK